MKHLLLVLLLATCITTYASNSPESAPLITLLANQPTDLVVSINTPSLDYQTMQIDGKDFLDFSLEGENSLAEDGFPDLPSVTRIVIVPSDGEIQIELLADETTTIQVSAPPRVFHVDNTDNTVFTSNEPNLNLNGIYPSNIVALGTAQTFRGTRLVPITFHPVQYDASQQTYTLHQNIQVAVRVSSASGDDIESVDDLLPHALTRDTYKFLNAIALNGPNRDDAGDQLPLGGYLIATNLSRDQVEPYIDQLADWKRACGHYVEIVYGEDNGENLRDNEIAEGYQNWNPPLEYACIIGPFSDNVPNDDVVYGCLDGEDDHIAEVAIGRLGATSPNRAGVVINRAIGYQREPWTGNMNWFDRAGAMAHLVGSRTPALDHTVAWIAEAERRAGFPQVLRHLVNDGGDTPYEWINTGLNLVFERGLSYSIRINGRFFPVWISVGGGHTPESIDAIWNNGSIQSPSGPSILTGTGRDPASLPCNVLSGGMARGLLIEDMPLGWARAYAMLMLDLSVSGSFDQFARGFRVLGDPSQKVWLGHPSRIVAEYDDLVSPDQNYFDVLVNLDDDENTPVASAMATLTVPGELLAWGYSDENGFCRLTLPQGMPDECLLTVTGDGLLPFFNEVETLASQLYLIGSIDEIDDEEHGNNDGILNPGETAFLRIVAHNSSDRVTAENISGVLTSSSPWLTVEDVELNFEEIPPGEQVLFEETVRVTLSPTAFQGTDLGLSIELTDGEENWLSLVEVEFEASCLIFDDLRPGFVLPPGLTQIDIELENTGSVDSPLLTAELQTESPWVQILDAYDSYEALAPRSAGEQAQDHFLINPLSLAPPGLVVPMTLLLGAEENMPKDTIRFSIQIDEPRRTGPNGPDGYGYVCFDNSDNEWAQARTYDWIEIDPTDRDRDFDGIQLRFQHNFPDQIWEIELPFEFQYYGERFDRVTISENGFLALGDNLERCVMYEDSPLDQMINGSFGMLAPFWDDLTVIAVEANIYWKYVEEDNLFIVQWDNIPCVNSNERSTFQVILFDEEFYETLNDDALFAFQYKDIRPLVRGNAPTYCSVGICSPNGKYGINYCSGNVYPAASTPLTNQLALLFTSSTEALTGGLFGNVIDVETNQPMEGVLIRTSNGQISLTDAEGNWGIPDAYALPFDITAWKQGWNDSTFTELDLEEGEEIEINFGLLHPTLVSTDWDLNVEIDPDMVLTRRFTLRNTGNGQLDWSVEKHLLVDDQPDPWVLRRSYPIGQTLQDSKIRGAVFADNQFFVSGSNDDEPMIYVLNREGELIRSFAQPRVEGDTRGIRDLAWDGELLWGCVGSGGNRVFGISVDNGEVVRQFAGPFRPTTSIAWDSEHEVLWMSNITSDIVAYTRDGERADFQPISRAGMRIYGMAYWQDDPNDCGLYIYHKEIGTNNLTVNKVNVDNPEVNQFASYLFPEEGGQPEGCFISTQFDCFNSVMVCVANEGNNDRIDIWQLDARNDWYSLDVVENENRVDADSGRIGSGESREFILDFDSTNMPDTLFQAELLFHHNADSGKAHVLVNMRVLGDLPPPSFSLLQPPDAASVNDPLVDFNWEASDDPNPSEQTTYNFVLNMGDDQINFQTDENSLAIDLRELLIDMDWLRRNFATWSVTASSAGDVVECNQPFSFMLQAPPSNFELITPTDNYQLVSRQVSFGWTESLDPNPEDQVEYRLWMESGRDSISVSGIESNNIVLALDTLNLTYDSAWPIMWWVDAIANEDTVECTERFRMTFPPNGLSNSKELMPAEFSINSIHPNPFNAMTTIVFGSDKSERIVLRAFDIRGREVATLYQNVAQVGWHQVIWNGAGLPTGVYMLRLEAAGRVKVSKIAMIK